MLAAGVAFALGLGWYAPASAQPIQGYPEDILAYDAREIALLPRYCRFTQDFGLRATPGGADPTEAARWERAFGPTFKHLHHYCWGLMKTNRAVLLARDRQVRRFYLSDSLGEFDYVLERAEPGFLLLPEILTRKAENLVLLDRGPTAMVALERAVAIKADYWPAYGVMGDYYKDLGDLAKAREVLNRGLEKAPEAEALKRRLRELGTSRAR